MPLSWPTSQLRHLADVRVSNVDKKSYTTEQPIRLCNYMDVYANDYLTSALLDFMPATASPLEIERFALHAGDVVITKDSETPDDIGAPAVIVEDIDGLVCGYHLALIRPKASVHPTFLAKQLASAQTNRYFAANATGSTRFGLAIGTIEKLDVPNPPIAEQAKIAEVLSTVDRAIEQSEALIAKQQRIKTGLMEDLLTRGIDEHGNLRSEQTHKFKDSLLGRIPVEWAVSSIGAEFDIQLGKMLSQASRQSRTPLPYLGNKNVQWDNVDLTNLERMDFDEVERKKFRLKPGDILVCEGGEVGRTCVWREELEQCFYQKAIHRLRPKRGYFPSLFPTYMRWAVRNGLLSDFTSRSSIAHLTKEKLAGVPMGVPSESEQTRISRATEATDSGLAIHRQQLAKLRALKRGLMQDLLTGNRRVTALLEQSEGATA